jgi:hypothetical protein
MAARTLYVPLSTAMAENGQEGRLPAWARETLHVLRREVRDQTRRADEARRSGGPEDTDVVLEPYDDVPVRLPKGSRVRFVLDPEGRGLHGYVDVYVLQGGGGPPVLAVAGGSVLAISPHASNLVHISA